MNTRHNTLLMVAACMLAPAMCLAQTTQPGEQAQMPNPRSLDTQPALQYHEEGAVGGFQVDTSRDNHFVLMLDWLGLIDLPTPDQILDTYPQYGSEPVCKQLREGAGLVRMGAREMSGRDYRIRDSEAKERISREYLVKVCTPSAEQGKQLVQALIDLYDAWWRDHGKEFLQHQLDQAEKEAAKARADLDEPQRQHEADMATLRGLYPLSKETISDLRTRELLLQVDLAGIHTKVERVDKLLQSQAEIAQHAASWREQLEMIKTSAQIDRAGVTAQQGQIVAILKAQDRLDTDKANYDRLGRQVNVAESVVEALKEAASAPPGFPLRVWQDTVQVQAIDWAAQPRFPMGAGGGGYDGGENSRGQMRR